MKRYLIAYTVREATSYPFTDTTVWCSEYVTAESITEEFLKEFCKNKQKVSLGVLEKASTDFRTHCASVVTPMYVTELSWV